MLLITRSLDTDQYQDLAEWRRLSMLGFVSVYDGDDHVGIVQTMHAYLDKDKQFTTDVTPHTVLVVMPFTMSDLSLMEAVIDSTRKLEMETTLGIQMGSPAAVMNKPKIWARFYSSYPVASIPNKMINDSVLLHNKIIVQRPLARLVSMHFNPR
jgi:hypothetical protein